MTRVPLPVCCALLLPGCIVDIDVPSIVLFGQFLAAQRGNYDHWNFKTGVFPPKFIIDWVVLEFTIIRTAAEGVKISVYFMRRLLSSLFNLAKMISILTMIG